VSCTAKAVGIVPGPQVICAVTRWYCVAEPKTTDGTAAVGAGAVKLAVTRRFRDMLTVQEPVPEQWPLQPVKVWLAVGVAVSRTVVPDAYEAVQLPTVLPQLVSPTPLTVPVPVPVLDTVRVLFAACADHETKSMNRSNNPNADRTSRCELKRREVGNGILKRTPRGAAVNAVIWISLAGGAAGIGCNGVAGLQ